METGQHTHTLICMHPRCLAPAPESEKTHDHRLLRVQELRLITTTSDDVVVVDVLAGSSLQALLALGYN